MLPLDADRHREHAVWLAFVTHAETDPALAELKRLTNVKMRELYSRIIRARRGLPVHTEGTAPPDPEVEADTLLLQSLLDGLTLQLVDLQRSAAVFEQLRREAQRSADPSARSTPGHGVNR